MSNRSRFRKSELQITSLFQTKKTCAREYLNLFEIRTSTYSAYDTLVGISEGFSVGCLSSHPPLSSPLQHQHLQHRLIPPSVLPVVSFVPIHPSSFSWQFAPRPNSAHIYSQIHSSAVLHPKYIPSCAVICSGDCLLVALYRCSWFQICSCWN